MPKATSVRRFGVFELDLESGELRRQGRRMTLHEKPFQVLTALLAEPGRVVTRQELRDHLWADGTFVDFDANLNAAVKKLRDALGDDAASPRFVETLPRRGYRFIAPVEALDAETHLADVREPTKSAPRLPWLLLAFGALVGVLVLAFFTLRSAPRNPPQAPSKIGDKLLLVVLPFENLDGNPERDYFADGLTEELITQLGRLQPERLGVIARTSAMAYKGTHKTVAEIAREIGVGYVLEGSVRSGDDTVRITGQLIQVDDQTHLWAETWDRPLDDILAVQREIAMAVARSLALELLPDDLQARARAATAVTAAYEEYLRGRDLWNRFEARSLRRAREHFERALELDPSFLHAEASLAETFNLLAIYDGPQDTMFEAAIRTAGSVLKRDPDQAEAHNALGYARLYHLWDLAGAEASFRRALEIAPNFAMAHHYYTGMLSAAGRHEEAIAACRRAEDLDPLSLSVRSDLGWYYLFAGRYEAAITECQETLAADPNYGWAISCLVEANAALGRWEAAWEAAQQRLPMDGIDPQDLLRPNDPEKPTSEVLLRRVREASLERQVTVFEKGEGSPLGLAIAFAHVGRHGEALEFLEQAMAEKQPMALFSGVHPAFRGLRSDPRFLALLQNSGLPDPAQQVMSR